MRLENQFSCRGEACAHPNINDHLWAGTGPAPTASNQELQKIIQIPPLETAIINPQPAVTSLVQLRTAQSQ